MTENIFAYTGPGCEYPGYVSINRNEAGDVLVSVRAAPTPVDGVRVCGVTCHPGKEHCNNYCNMHPDRTLPMPDHPERHNFNREGATSSFTIPATEWEALAPNLTAPEEICAMAEQGSNNHA